MHVKSISNTITTSITLGAGAYGDKLTITGTGAVKPVNYGATAITAPEGLNKADVLNQGTVIGGVGTSQAGYIIESGVGIYLGVAGHLDNSGTISGGFGGVDYYYSGNPGVVGGVGVDMASGGTLTNSGRIAGGEGGSIYVEQDATAAGAGGVGVAITSGLVTITRGRLA